MKQCLLWFVLIAGLGLVGCQMEPTKIVETQKLELVQINEKAQKSLELNDETVVLDVRSSFDFGLDHVRNSYLFPWQNLAEDPRTGEVLRDKHTAALRLSLLGLTPATPVVVVGYGPLGQGEEGRLAWNLLYLGFQDVQVSSVIAFRHSMTQEPSPAAQNAVPWKVNAQGGLQIERGEFLQLASGKGLPTHVIIIDVRSEKEYLALSQGPEGKKASLPNVTMFNIEWRQFFTGQGRPDLHFKSKLIALGIHPEDHIVMISNRGVRSAAATYALLAMGYPHVQNFTGGRNSLK